MNRLVCRVFCRWRGRDPLTGLCNRKQLFKDLNSALVRSDRVALIFADVDEFRNVNTGHGYDFGDNVLRGIAKVLTAKCPDSRTLGPYRDGGESFSFVLTRGVEDARTIAEALRAAVEQLRFGPHGEVKVTIRLAIAVAPEDGKTPTELWHKVQSVIYCHPHERRRNRVV